MFSLLIREGGKISMIIGKNAMVALRKPGKATKTGGVFGGRSTGWSVAR